MFYLLRTLLRPRTWLLWPGQRGRRITPFGIYVGICVALNYRPGHPWSGIVGGIYAIFLIVFLMYARAVWYSYRHRG